MVVSFERFPWILQVQIVEKMSVREFLNFMKSSKYTDSVSNQIKHKIPSTYKDKIEKPVFHDNISAIGVLESLAIRVTIRLLSISGDFSDDFCKTLLKSFKISQLQANLVHFHGDSISCSLDNFNTLLTIAKVKEVKFVSKIASIPADYFRVPAVKQLENIHVMSPFTDNDLLFSTASKLFIDQCKVTSKGVNLILKEWMSKKREINSYFFEIREHFDVTIVLEGIPHEIYDDYMVDLQRNNEKLRVYIEQNICLFLIL